MLLASGELQITWSPALLRLPRTAALAPDDGGHDWLDSAEGTRGVTLVSASLMLLALHLRGRRQVLCMTALSLLEQRTKVACVRRLNFAGPMIAGRGQLNALLNRLAWQEEQCTLF